MANLPIMDASEESVIHDRTKKSTRLGYSYEKFLRNNEA